MNMNGLGLLWAVFFGSIGLGFFMYGRKQKRVPPLVCGLLLMVYPYFVSNNTVVIIIGAILCAIPYFMRQKKPPSPW